MGHTNRTRILILLSAVLLTVVLLYGIAGQKSPADRLFLQITYGEQEQRLNCWEDEDGQLYFFLPAGSGGVTWSIKGRWEYRLDGQLLLEGSSCQIEPGQKYELQEGRASGLWNRKYSLTFLQSQQLPSAFLTTDTGKTEYLTEDKEYSESGSLTLVDADGQVDYAGDFSRIKGRGNYTWLLDKKSFSLDFEQAQGLLGMDARNEWVLIAQAAEDTHLINRMVFEMMREAGIEAVQQSSWVDLYINGDYAGNYLLSQKVWPQKEIDEGSFLVEFDGYWKEEGGIGFDTAGGESLSIRYPEDADAETQKEVAAVIQQVENAVLSEEGTDPESGFSWRELADEDSLVKKYVLDELTKSPDGWNGSNYCYMREGKLYFGAPWDYEFAFGNQLAHFSWLSEPYGMHHETATAWYAALCEDAGFSADTAEIYRDFFRPYLTAQITDGLDLQAEYLAASMAMDSKRWNRPPGDFVRELRELKYYIRERLRYLDQEWLGIPMEEEVPYYTLRLMDGETEYAVYHLRENSLPEAEMLEREDASFTGWYWDEDCTQAVTEAFLFEPVTEDLVLYAGFDRLGTRIRLLGGLIPLGLIVTGLFLLLVSSLREDWGPGRGKRGKE